MLNRGKLLFVALIAGGSFLGSLLYQLRQPERSALQPYNSGFAASLATGGSSPFINFISKPTFSDSVAGFSYWTGGLSRGTHPLLPANNNVVAAAQQGKVQVELKSESLAAHHAPLAEAVASHVVVATTNIWPAAQVPVAVELYQVPPNSSYEFAREIHWREGRPFHLTLFITDSIEDARQAGIAVHELYHVLATRWRLGSKSERGIASTWLGTLYEEVTASLLADCSHLLVAGRLTLPEAEGTFVLNEADGSRTTYRGSFDSEGLAFILDPAEDFGFPPGFIAELLHRTAMQVFVPGDEALLAGSDSAEQLLALCRTATGDPWHLEQWFQNLDSLRSTSPAG